MQLKTFNLAFKMKDGKLILNARYALIKKRESAN